jgi:hypothetical protein
MWSSPDVIGLFSNNVVLSDHLFSLNSVPKPRMLSVRAVYAFSSLHAGLLSHADGSGLLPEARPKLTALSWEEIRLALMLDIGSN